MKLKKGDQIIVTTGKDKGQKGKIEQVFPKKDLVLVPGLNMYKRHTKPRNERDSGGIIDAPRPLAVAKVALVCSSCNKPTRVGYVVSKRGKERICRKCNQKV